MKGLKKLVLVSAIAAAPLAAQAELKAIDDAAMSEMTGQSGLLIEVALGSADKADITNVDWTNAGLTIEAFKWEVDLELYDSTTNQHTTTASGAMGGVIAQGIKVAGTVDMTVDGVTDGTHGGIAIGFEGSSIDMRVDSISTYAAGVGIGASMGAIEILGMNLSNVDITISGK